MNQQLLLGIPRCDKKIINIRFAVSHEHGLRAVRHTSGNLLHSAPFINLLPVFTVILGMLLLHESVSAQEMVGAPVTLIGALLTGLQSGPVPLATKSTF